MIKAATMTCAALFLVGCSGSGGGGTGGGGGGGVSYPAPSVVGTYGFDAGFVGPSTQTGGGATAGDNMSVGVEEGCTGSGNKTVNLQVFSRDHSMLTAGTFQISNSANLFASVSYSDFGSPGAQLSASSGQVVFDNIDFASLGNNRGSFSVQLDLDDGGTSPLNGTFDARYLCH